METWRADFGASGRTPVNEPAKRKGRNESLIIIYPVNTTFPSTRANTIQILQTANALAAAGADVHLVTKQGQADREEIAQYYGIQFDQKLTMHPVPAPAILRTPKAHESMVLKKTLALLGQFRGKSKIVFTRDPLFASLLMRARSVMRFKLIYEAHTLFFVTAKETYMPVAWNQNKEKRIMRREKRVFTSADAIVWISSSLQQFVKEYFPVQSPSIVVHDGTTIPDRIPRAKKNKVICYSGQFYWWKGLSTLIEAMRWIDGAVLRLYGGGYSTVHDDLAIMQKVIDEHKLHKKIELKGFVQPSAIADAISECSIGVLPLPKNIIANRCNSPLKLFDYMANGLAVISSDLLTVREIITHGVNGHLVEPENPKALADGINQLISNTAYRESLVENAFDTVQKFTWEVRGRQLLNFFETIVH